MKPAPSNSESDPKASSWTVGRLLQWTAEFLKKHGADSPRLDAEVLLAHCRGSRRIDLYTAFDEVPAEDVLARFRALVKRRAAHEPVAYLVGTKEFYSLPFRVSRDVLIPRPETELLVMMLIDLLQNSDNPQPRIVDVGTGSGIIAITAAKHVPRATVAALDLSPVALEVARGNANALGVSERIEFVQGDLFEALSAEARFDVIASNPPYVSEDEFASLAPDVREHEPKLALVAGPTGTEVIERLAAAASEWLVPEGHLLLEVSPMIAGRVVEILEQMGRFVDVQAAKDLAGQYRLVRARRTSAC